MRLLDEPGHPQAQPRDAEERARDALWAAEDDARRLVRGGRAEHGRAGEARHADAEDAQLAVDVAERAADEDERAEREQVGVDDPLLRGEPASEVALDRLQR